MEKHISEILAEIQQDIQLIKQQIAPTPEYVWGASAAAAVLEQRGSGKPLAVSSIRSMISRGTIPHDRDENGVKFNVADLLAWDLAGRPNPVQK